MKSKMEIEPADIPLANRVEDGLKRRTGKKWAITSKRMVKILQSEGFNVNDAKLRAIIRHLVLVREVFICGDSSGFYVPETNQEREDEIKLLSSRIDKIRIRRDKLLKMQIKLTSQPTIFENGPATTM